MAEKCPKPIHIFFTKLGHAANPQVVNRLWNRPMFELDGRTAWGSGFSYAAFFLARPPYTPPLQLRS